MGRRARGRSPLASVRRVCALALTLAACGGSDDAPPAHALANDGPIAAASTALLAKVPTGALLDGLGGDTSFFSERALVLDSHWPLVGELQHRRDDCLLVLEAFEHPVSAAHEERIAYAIVGWSEPEVLDALKTRALAGRSTTDWLCLDYLAARGDERALFLLNANFFRFGCSSVEWSETIRHFGTFRYRPAILNLIDALDAASLNVGGAAHEALERIFPGPHPEIHEIASGQEYFTRLAQDGL